MKTVDVTLRFRCTVTEHPELEEVGNYVESFVRQWTDGRRPFHVEAMQVSMEQILTGAIRAQVDDFCQTEYGDQRVVTGPTSSTSRACLEAEELCEKMRVTAGCPVVVDVSVSSDEAPFSPALARFFGGFQADEYRRAHPDSDDAHLTKVLKRYVPGEDSTSRPFETRATAHPVDGDRWLTIRAAYTDDQGGTLAVVGLSRQERDALLSFLLAVRAQEEEVTMKIHLIAVLVLVFTVACSGPRPSCFDLCPAGETTGLLSDQCPASNVVPNVDVNCVCLTKAGTKVPVTDCEVKATPGKGTYDYVCEDTCR